MRHLALASLLALLPAAAAAQESTPTEDRPALRMNEVERGIFFGAEAGGLLLFGPASRDGSGGMCEGRSAGITLGVDFGELFSVAALVMGTTVDAPAGYSGPGNLRGDFSALTLGAMAKVSPYGVPDANGVKRLFVYARAGGGLSLMGPANFFPSNDILVFAGAGLEYFNHLRHFSVGLSADFVLGLNNLKAGLQLAPALRYTF